MLMLFALSIAPKRYLHDLFATHKDIETNKPTNQSDHFNKKGFVCDCNTLVATSPFIEQETVFNISVTQAYLELYTFSIPFIYTSFIPFIELRGPPTIG